MIEQIYSYLRDDLNRVEQFAQDAIASDFDSLEDSIKHLLDSGGKRLRPIFILLTGKLSPINSITQEHLCKTAAAVELMHAATLVHDDSIDRTDYRRGERTIRSYLNDQAAVYIGDFIFARSMLLMFQCHNQRAQFLLAKCMKEICAGEIKQLRSIFDLDQSILNYMRCIRRKTAIVLGLSCRLGAMVSGLDNKSVGRLYQFGYMIGMAFQLVDDILDLTGDASTLGKSIGTDLRNGNMTLPILFAYQQCSPSQRELLKKYSRYGSAGSEDESLYQNSLEIVLSSKAIHSTKLLVDKFIEKALNILSQLSNEYDVKYLHTATHFISKRSY